MISENLTGKKKTPTGQPGLSVTVSQGSLLGLSSWTRVYLSKPVFDAHTASTAASSRILKTSQQIKILILSSLLKICSLCSFSGKF